MAVSEITPASSSRRSAVLHVLSPDRQLTTIEILERVFQTVPASLPAAAPDHLTLILLTIARLVRAGYVLPVHDQLKQGDKWKLSAVGVRVQETPAKVDR